MRELKTELVKLSKLKPDTRNARLHDERNIEEIKRSLVDNEQYAPLIVQRSTGKILAGNGRYTAMKQLDWQECYVTYIDCTDEEAIKIALADNRTSELAEWDFATLKDLMQELGPEPDVAGWSNEEIEDMFQMFSDEETEVVQDEIPEVQKDTVSQRGYVWICGNHRVMCGDSTLEADTDKLANGERADMVFTDPPYGMKKESEGIQNDNLNYDDLLVFNKEWIALAFKFMSDVGSFYCWGIEEPLMDIYSEILKPMKKQKGQDKITFRNLIIWNKGVAQGINSELYRGYPMATELCLFCMKGRQTYGATIEDYWEGFEPLRLYFDTERKKTGLSTDELIKLAGASTITHWWSKSQWEFPNEARYKKLQTALKEKGIDALREEYDALREEYDALREEYDALREEWYKTRAYFDNTHENMTNVWDFSPTSQIEREETGGHATPKPIALCARAIKTSSKENGTVFDFFGGSGSTLIACEQLNRKCYTMEIDPQYVDVIVRRWQKLTGEDAILEGTGETFNELAGVA